MIIRVRHENHFTTVRNRTIRDSRLSFKARGLLVYLLSLPDDTRVARADLAKVGPDGVKAIRSALKELTTAGYLSREVVRGERGRLTTVTTVRERPTTDDSTGGPLRTTTRRTTAGGASIRRNKEGAPAAGAATPPEDLCLVCGVHAAYWYTRGGKGFCDEHRAEYALQRMEEEK